MEHTDRIDGRTLAELFTGGMANLKLNASVIDDLNVFPIPDGDTGNNMLMTIEGGVKAGDQGISDNVGEFARAFARGALLGARGNSGVILSQFFKGFSTGCEGKESLGIREFTDAFKAGVDKAYSAVIQPTEGTILTVMREGWEYISGQKDINDFSEYFSLLGKKMEESLEHTPELLPILKESGVIDSGGAGFLCIFHGMERTLNGEQIEGAAEHRQAAASAPAAVNLEAFTADSELEFGYCTEFILRLQNRKTDIEHFNLDTIISYLDTIGNSIVAVKDDDLIKVHVHTFTPGKVLDFGQRFGEFITLKIENMSVQHNENHMFKEAEEHEVNENAEMAKYAEAAAHNHNVHSAEHKPIAVVTVVNGPGLKEFFTELGVDVCVDGGQTENPSTEDFINAFKTIDADHIIVLPCNSNIVMAATQAAELYDASKVHVVKAKTIAEGYSAISMMNLSDENIDRVISEMEDCIRGTKTGLITTATRDVDYDHIKVYKDHYIGLDRDGITADAPDRLDAFKATLNAIDDIRDREVLTIFYGAAVPETELEGLGAMIEKDFPWMEYGYISGGQAVYDYIFAVE